MSNPVSDEAEALFRISISEAPLVDNVNHPPHYGNDTPYETIKVLKAWLTAEQYQGFLIGNVIKYQSRYRNKGGVEDLKKSAWYLNKYIEEFPNDKPGL